MLKGNEGQTDYWSSNRAFHSVFPDEAGGTIGRGRLVNPKVKYTFLKDDDGTTRLKRFRLVAAYEDLYDFNYEDPGLGKNATALQIGYGQDIGQRKAGLIYRNRVLLDNEYSGGVSIIVGGKIP